MVDGAVECVRDVEGGVQGAAGHGVGTAEDVARVPEDEGEGNC